MDVSEDEREALFKEKLKLQLEKIVIKPFEPGNLEWARSEAEIAKCQAKFEKSQLKALLKERDQKNKKDEQSREGAESKKEGFKKKTNHKKSFSHKQKKNKNLRNTKKTHRNKK